MTNLVWIRCWHIARAYGYIKGVPEVDTLCGRRVYRQWVPDRVGAICKTCERIAANYRWTT